MTATCATCTHWRQSDDWNKPSPDNVPQPDRANWGWCDLIGLPEYGEVVTVTAYTKDGSDYKADLFTRSDFGCTLHQVKP